MVLLRFVWVAQQYPYYFAWDMDLTATEDSILIQSGFLPDVIIHPATGVYLLLYPSVKVARSLDVISVSSLADIEGSLNPLAGVAELTAYLRAHSPFLAMGIALLLWGTLVLVFRPSALWRLVLFIVLGTQASLVFHSTLLRSSLYSLFFWSAGILFVALAATAKRPPTRYGWLFVAGCAMGLSLMAKIQAAFYVAAAPLFYLLISQHRREHEGGKEFAAVQSRALGPACWVSIGCVLVFGLLLVAAHRTPLPEGVSRWRGQPFGLTLQAGSALLAMAALAVGQCSLASLGRTDSRVYRMSLVLTALLLGFIGSFLLPFLLYDSLAQSFTHLCLTLKMLFLRRMHDAAADFSASPLGVAKLFFLDSPVTFCVHALCLGLVVFRGVAPGGRRTVFWAVPLSMLAALSVVLGSRSILRDLIWAELLVNFLTLVFAMLLVSSAKAPWTALTGALLVLLAASNTLSNANMPARIDANYNNYGWQDEPWLWNVYGHNQLRYRDVMSKRYRTGGEIAKRQAMRHEEIRRAVGYVFKNQRVTHRNIGTVAEGFPAWTKALEWRIKAFPEKLREAVLVDNGSLPLRRRFLFHKEKVQGTSEDINKVKRVDQANHLAMLGRSDLRILLFVHEEDARNLTSPKLVPCEERITLSNGDESVTLAAFEAFSYVEVPVTAFKRRFFTVIQFRDPKLYFPYDVNLMSGTWEPATHRAQRSWLQAQGRSGARNLSRLKY